LYANSNHGFFTGIDGDGQVARLELVSMTDSPLPTFDMQEKINPYLRPLYDALFHILGNEKVQKLVARGVIEVAPLAFMRGRTLNDAFVILDEAQNCSSEQMKMFLTRIGLNSKAVVTGDITQIDLPSGQKSGLVEAREILSHKGEISFCNFSERDSVRHRIVKLVIQAYSKAQK